MKQQTFAIDGFEAHRKTTRKAEFLSRMDKLVPWSEFCKVIAPFYPKAGNGRPPIGLERMLRMYFIANWFNLADEACEDALYDVEAFCFLLPPTRSYHMLDRATLRHRATHFLP